MQLIVPSPIISKLRAELVTARRVEIGGMLFAEHLGGADFRLHDVTIQRSGGNAVCFVRDPALHVEDIARLKAETGNDPLRFNYLGEWHSHPSFPTSPSLQDYSGMTAIAADPDYQLPQVVLLIVRLRKQRVEMAAYLFQNQRYPIEIDLVVDDVQPETPPVRSNQKPQNDRNSA